MLIFFFYTKTVKHVTNNHFGGVNAEVESAFEKKFSTSFLLQKMKVHVPLIRNFPI